MSTFEIRQIKEIEGKLRFYKLFVNSVCQFDVFLDRCEEDGNYRSELIQISSRLHQLANLKTMPITKFRDITPVRELHKEYEIKTANLRVYLFHDKQKGRIIVCGGKKTSQQKDLQYFRRIKNDYFNQKL